MSLATLEARNGTRTASARALAYHSPVTSSSSARSEGEWIAQVADGDAESALGMQTMTLSDCEKRVLTNAVLSASDSRIVVESVEGKTSRWRVGKFARVEAPMSVNGEPVTHEFLVYRRKPMKDNPAEWYLRDGLLVRVAVTGNRVPGFSVRGDSAGVEPLSKSW